MSRRTNIEEIYDTYSQTLYFTSLRIVGNSFDAEEIMHDTILKYNNVMSTAENIVKPLSWLKSVCIRKSIDKLREKHRTKEFLEEYMEETVHSTVSPPPQYSAEEVRNALMQLPHNYHTILSLHLFEGYDYQEIEQITGTKEATLRSLYKRAKEKLAETIQIRKNLQHGKFGTIHTEQHI